MIDLGWLADELGRVLCWQLEHPGALDGPEVPWAGRRVWSIFLELNATRTVGMVPNPISMGEIESWSHLRREPIRPFEVEIIQALDAALLKAAQARQESPKEPPKPTRKFSFDWFDAVFS